MNKCYIIDGNSLLFRAFYATYRGDDSQIMRTKNGVPTNAIFAFSNMINKILNSLKEGDAIFVAFDTSKPTFRHLEDKDYKANRKPCPPLLSAQMPIARELLKALNIFTYEKEGYEADDIAGTFAKKAAKEGYEVIVYTSDKDYLQLIDENISIHLLKTGMSNIVIMNEESMMNEYHIKPLQIIDYKGLRGDTSDNLPGIPGIGEKTAIKLIQEYGSFENIIAAAPSLKSKVGENIVLNADKGRLSYVLARIDINVDLPFLVTDTVYEGYDFNIVNEFASKYELRQFLNKLPSKLNKSATNDLDEIEINYVTSFEKIDFKDELGIALDKDEGNYNDAIVYGIALDINEKIYYIKLDDAKKDQKLLDALSNTNIKKYCYDYKAIKVSLKHNNIDIDGLYFDALLSAYLLDSSLKENIEGVMHYFGINFLTNEDNSISLFDNSNPKKAAKTAYLVKKIAHKAIAEMDKNELLNLYLNVEVPLCSVLSNMEIEGFPLNGNTLESIGENYKEKMEHSKQKIYELAEEEFNIDSPKQVADILFNKLGLPANKKQSTSVDVLKELINYHPIVSEILAYRKYAKLLSTYVYGLLSHIKEDGKIHTIFNQALTSTGRLSSSEPNLQNISTRDEESKLIRKAFYYDDENYWILSLDYSQIELRILASLSGSSKLQQVFLSDEDIHTSTAKNVFHTDNITSELRRRAKAINFGIIYGISDWGLAEQLGVSLKEAKNLINSFYENYPEVGLYFKKVVEETEKNSYATTLLGRRRYLREIHDSNYQVREFARRAAMNAPIQGSAADLIKVAMIKVDQVLKEKKLKTKLVLQIHDELLFKVPTNEKEIALSILKDTMEHALDLDVKLVASGGYGRNWFDAK